jgi:regulator of protease activity HflC (stomatin/prohibitin superfamily)
MVQFDPKEDNKFCWRFWGCALNSGSMCCWITSIVLGVGALLLIVLLALSVKDIDENEVGIPYDQVARKLGDVKEAGKHVFTPAVKLFTFDRKFITNDLQVNCISKDGLIVTVDVTQQYQLIKEQLKTVLFEFGEQEVLDDYIDTIAQDTIRDVCATFNGEEFFSKRGDVEQRMINNLTKVVAEADAHAEPGFVQLKNIALPQALLTAIQNKQLALEDVDVANNERAQKLIQKETEKQEASLDAQIKLVAANATANGIRIAATEKANARLIQWSERQKAFIIDLDALEIDPEVYVDDYLFPRLRAQTLTPTQQSCLQTCPPATACWYCFTTAIPAVSV